MIDSKYRISLDIHSTASNVRLKCKRGDTGRTIYAALTERGFPYHISDDCYAVFTATKPDGNKVFNKCRIEDCVIVYEFTPQTVAVPGLLKCEIKLYGADDQLITSPSFLLEVHDAQVNDGDELESEKEVEALTHLISQAIGMNAKLEKVPNFGGGAKVGYFLMVSEVDEKQQMVTVVPVEAPSGGGNADLTGYATEQFVQDGFQPKGDYLPSEELPNAVNDALADAKESGAFDGKNGSNGLSILAVNITAGDAQKIEVYPDNVIENEGALFPRDILLGDKVLTQDGKIFIVDSWGTKFDSSSGTNITYYKATFFVDAGGVKSVNGIAPDENGNVEIKIPDSSQNVDLTGYAKETWVQESFQPKGDYLTEHQSLDGYAKTEDIPTKPEDIGAQPAGNYLTEHQDISGKLDKNQGSANVGKILVVGSDGNLTLTDMPEGSVSGDVIGVLDASNNILLSGNLADGTYTLKYENADGTYTNVGTLEVGEAGPAYINLAEPNTTNTTDTTIWCNEARLAATGAVETKSGYIVTNYIPVKKGQTARIKNLTIHRIGVFKTDKTPWVNSTGGCSTLATNKYIESGYVSTDTETTIVLTQADTGYVRFAGTLTGTAEDVIITVDQEIV